MDDKLQKPIEQDQWTNDKNDVSQSAPAEQPAPLSNNITTDTEKQDVTPSVDAAPQVTVGRGRRNFKKPLLLSAVIIVLLAAGAVAYIKTRPQTRVADATPAKHKVASQPAKQLSGNTFFAAPKPVDSRHFFSDFSRFGTDCSGQENLLNTPEKCTPSYSDKNISYYQIGTTAAKQPIIMVIGGIHSESDWQYMAIEDQPDHYQLLAKPSNMYLPTTDAAQTIADYKSGLAPNVVLDISSDMPELEFPVSVTAHGESFSIPRYSDSVPRYGYFTKDATHISSPYFDNDLSIKPDNSKEIGHAGDTTIYQVLASDTTNYQIKEVFGVLHGMFAQRYQLDDPLLSTTSKPKINWTEGEQTTAGYFSGAMGCGYANGYLSLKGISDSSLTKVGTTASGESVYQVPTSAAIFNEVYTNDYRNGSSLISKSLMDLTTNQFQAQHALIVTKNSVGDYVLHLRNDMFQYGGCGKPVVYLYPTATSQVSVKVGANVTASDPTYTPNGWKNVLAQPNGTLTYQGKIYPSLFWEGIGQGPYPQNITFGTVVPYNRVVDTIKSQLAAQGFNPKEINDFLAFWQPRLPNTPYTRLSWLSTAQMNQLAPLTISPRPTTVIRTFLDFQGLNQPVTLQPQSFHAPTRQGFTVVEWGGLLVSN